MVAGIITAAQQENQTTEKTGGHFALYRGEMVPAIIVSGVAVPEEVYRVFQGNITPDVLQALAEVKEKPPVLSVMVAPAAPPAPSESPEERYAALGRAHIAAVSGHFPTNAQPVRSAAQAAAQFVKRVVFLPPAVQPAERCTQSAGEAAQPTNLEVRFDPETARIAAITTSEYGNFDQKHGNFALYRAWLYLRSINHGSGKIERSSAVAIWKRSGVATSPQYAGSLIDRGDGVFWNYDAVTGNLYLKSEYNVTAFLMRSAAEIDPYATTNKPGGVKMIADLSGTIGQAKAQAYAAWIAGKNKRGETMMSNAALSGLWAVHRRTIKRWQRAAGVQKRANFARSSESDRVPQHAVKRGAESVWQLPNTYYLGVSSIRAHEHFGTALKIQKSLRKVSHKPANHAVAVLRVKLYFQDKKNKSAAELAEKHLRSIAKKSDGDVFVRRYAKVTFYRRSARVWELVRIANAAQDGVTDAKIAG